MNNAKPEDSITSQDENSECLSEQWQSIDWQEFEKQVSRMQMKISKATISGRFNDSKRFSYLLTHSFTAKALAVKIVTSNKGSHTAGVDNVLWETDAQKMKAVLELDPNHYSPKPLRRVEIPKKNGKTRPLGIPTMHDRAMQTLYQLALDPICEATSDPNSYGFRKGRSTQDAIEQLFIVLAGDNKAEWVLEGDIKGCFDHISHEWLMSNIPMDKKILRKFLKAGYVFDKTLFPTDEGTPQGGSISPTLANMTLNGMEKLLKEQYPKMKVNLVRYADDFIVTAQDEETAQSVKETLKGFLSERGLELSESKTLITNINDGFDFLGFTLKKFGGKLIIKPSKGAFNSIKDSAREVVLGRGKAASQDDIITRLNPKITGWCNYYRKVCSKKTFSALHDYLFHLLKQWAHRKHSRKSLGWIYGKYWQKIGENEWMFSSETQRLVSPKEVSIVRHLKVRSKANPYLDREYFAERKRPGKTVKR